ncbi:hypothetical protein MTR67_052143 [Solanum verrucosum]|uniref:Uncharacterized protein n=1 Tax=Solanum verrucosum TaxID=315347 RepID=A0AAF1A2N5_SOLVR|nr:hypothetical protein MTR67_052143 [Solanum verrucosum]
MVRRSVHQMAPLRHYTGINADPRLVGLK